LRILIVNKYARVVGGADKHSVLLARGLRDRGHDVAFLATDHGQLEWHDGEFVRCSVVGETRDQIGFFTGGRVAGTAMWNHEAASAMRRLIRTFKPDLVHSHKLYPQLSVAPIAVASRAGIPVIQTAHDYEGISASPYDPTGSWLDADEARLPYRVLNTATFAARRFARSNFISSWVSVSRYVAEAYARHGIRSIVLPNFVEDGDGYGAVGFDQRDGIVYAGTLTSAKGAQDAVELARRLPDVSVTIAGDGDLRGFVAASSERLPNLSWLGRIPGDEMRNLLSHARVAIVPSRCDDAGPMIAVEAMAAGTPIVAYARGGLSEYVTDSGAGVLADGVQQLATLSADLQGDKERWTQHADAGRRAAGSRHSLREYLVALEDFYASRIGL